MFFSFLSGKQRLLLSISIASAIAFLCLIDLRPYPGCVLLKWLPVGTLGFVVLFSRFSGMVLFFAIAIFFHSTGDVLLEIDRVKYLRLAMLFFGIGHLGYIISFWQNRIKPLNIYKNRIPMLAIMILLSIGMFLLLYPRLEMQWKISITSYLLVIATMSISTIFINHPSSIMSWGALLYMISDSMIAINTFVWKCSLLPYGICPTYYLGQTMIILGFLQMLDYRRQLSFSKAG